MKWLIIGTGWISEEFIKALRTNNQEVLGVYSRTKEKGDAFATKNNIPNVITLLDDLSKYDIAYIGTPNIIHYNQAEEVINKGLDVMIEKPMTHSYELTKELFELANQKGVKIMEAYPHITNPVFHTLKGISLKTNFMQLSSKIKNNTYESASSFNKELFGGVIPDLGVYPISFAIMVLGNVIKTDISNIKHLNQVIVDCKINLTHENGTSEFRISKLKDGDNSIYLDGKRVFDHISDGKSTNRMNNEIKVFIENKNLDFYKNISIETARVVELLLKDQE